MLCNDEYFMAAGGFLALFGWMIWMPLSIIGVIMLMVGFATID